MKHCAVMDCPNTKTEGRFVGSLCAPCFDVVSSLPRGVLFNARSMTYLINNIALRAPEIQAEIARWDRTARPK